MLDVSRALIPQLVLVGKEQDISVGAVGNVKGKEKVAAIDEVSHGADGHARLMRVCQR